MQKHPSSTSTEGGFKKKAVRQFVLWGGGTGPVRVVTGTGGLWACAAGCHRARGVGCAPPPFPGIIPVLGCQALTLAGETPQRGAEPQHVQRNPPGGSRHPLPGPLSSRRAEPLLPPPRLAPLPGGAACFLRPTGDVSLPHPWVGLLHAWLYVQTCASGSSLKGGEGDLPDTRGRFWGWLASVFCCR